MRQYRRPRWPTERTRRGSAQLDIDAAAALVAGHDPRHRRDHRSPVAVAISRQSRQPRRPVTRRGSEGQAQTGTGAEGSHETEREWIASTATSVRSTSTLRRRSRPSTSTCLLLKEAKPQLPTAISPPQGGEKLTPEQKRNRVRNLIQGDRRRPPRGRGAGGRRHTHLLRGAVNRRDRGGDGRESSGRPRVAPTGNPDAQKQACAPW
jgi:hypothetical protein